MARRKPYIFLKYTQAVPALPVILKANLLKANLQEAEARKLLKTMLKPAKMPVLPEAQAAIPAEVKANPAAMDPDGRML